MKIALLNPPSENLILRDYYCAESAKADYLWPPLDFLVLSGILSEETIDVIDCVAERLQDNETISRLSGFNPDWIISLTAGFRFHRDIAFIRKAHEIVDSPVLLLGDIPFANPDHILDAFDWITGVIVDFADPSIRMFLNGTGEPSCVVTRKSVRKSEKIEKKPLSYPIPRHELFRLDRYRLPMVSRAGGRLTCILTNLGCPYNCTYCSFPAIFYRERPMKEVLEEWKHLIEMGIDGVFIRDLTLGVSTNRIHELCEALIRMNNPISWTCEVRLDFLDRETIRMMKDAGCSCICFGLESLDDRRLVQMERRTDLKKIRDLSRFCRSIGLKTLAHYIIGFPGDSTLSSIRNILKVSFWPLDFVAWNRYVPRFGSQLRKILCDNETVITDEPDLDVTGGTPGQRVLMVLASCTFYSHPFRILDLFKLLGFHGMTRQCMYLWKRLIGIP